MKLIDLQRKIEHEEILRARSMTPGQRLKESFELSEEAFKRMYAGVVNQLGLTDEGAVWDEVDRRLARIDTFEKRELEKTYR